MRKHHYQSLKIYTIFNYFNKKMCIIYFVIEILIQIIIIVVKNKLKYSNLIICLY